MFWGKKVKRVLLVFLIISCLSLFVTQGAWGTTEVGTATIETNVKWTIEGSPYIVNSLTVETGGGLTIDSGVIVKFRNSGSIDVKGKVEPYSN